MVVRVYLSGLRAPCMPRRCLRRLETRHPYHLGGVFWYGSSISIIIYLSLIRGISSVADGENDLFGEMKVNKQLATSTTAVLYTTVQLYKVQHLRCRAAPPSGAERATGLWLRRAQCMNINKRQNGPMVLVSPR